MGLFNLFPKKDIIPERFLEKIREAKEKQLDELDLSNHWNQGKRKKI